jgi:hypothetical protein
MEFKKGYLYKSIGYVSAIVKVTETNRSNSAVFTGRALLSNSDNLVVGKISHSWVKDYGWEEIGPLEVNTIDNQNIDNELNQNDRGSIND